ncbi:unnamed protein product [Microthlaspi erraticum]|uniref:Uncharacterized protein n=1 Tax=Microthlaspi erraticum TaxID=1685480 RepID=A0A6D2IT93_9BRAS|nr:unnamed protein product [Microthlaspi erraticum]
MYSLILHGRRLIELQKVPHLRFAAQNQNPFFAFPNSFSSAADVSPLQDGRKGHNFTVSYLVDSLGLTTKLAASISRKVSFESKANPDSVLSLLRSHGFTDSQISDIVTDYPLLLTSDAEKSLAPKLQFLQSRGASTSELTEILTKVPKILRIKKDKAISRYYDFAKEIIEADKSSKLETLCHSSLPQGSMQDNKIRNVLALRALGVPQKLLLPLLISDHRNICCGKERFEESLKKVVEMGFDPTSSKFVQAMCLVYGFTEETIQGKVQVYKSLGFPVEDVWAIFKKWPQFLINSEVKILNSKKTFLGLGFSGDEFVMMVKRFPQCIGLSAESLKKKTEFLVKEMNWPLKAVAAKPQFIGYSMEKRIVPRCNVIKALMSKGSKLPVMSSVLLYSDESFLNRFVRKHDDKELVADLMAIFHRRS